MAKYIEQEAAVKAFENTKGHGFGFDLTDIKKIITNIPAANVAPVVHGRWVHDGRRFKSGVDWCHCSECEKKDNFAARTNFCPNCGAKMDLEDK